MEELNNLRIQPVSVSDIKQEKEEEEEEEEQKTEFKMECVEPVLRPWENSVKIENTNDTNDSMEWENSTETSQETLVIEQEEDDMLLNHVLLPRVLTQNTPDELHNTESHIIYQMIGIADNWSTKWLPRKTVELLRMLKEFHIGCTPDTISENINNLRPGDTFAMFIRAQHCAILIHVPDDEINADDVIVAVFPGSLDPSKIYSRDSGIEVQSFDCVAK